MRVTIQCPDCLSEYAISDKNLGKSVICANKECGTKFVAALNDNAPSKGKSQRVESTKANQRSTPPVLPHPPLSKSELPTDAHSAVKVQRSTSEAGLRKWVIVFAGLSIAEAVAIVVLSAFHLSTTPPAQRQESQNSERRSQSHNPEESTRTAANPSSPIEVLESQEFRKSIGEYLAFSHRMLKLIRRTSSLSFRVTYDFALEGVRERGSKIHVPSHFADPKAILSTVREIEDDFARCVSMTEATDEPDLHTREEILRVAGSGLKREVPQELSQELAKVSLRIENFANKNDISRDELFGARKFREAGFELVGGVQKILAKLDKLPAIPKLLNILDSPSTHGVTLEWSSLPEPAQSMPHRQKLLDEIDQMHNETFVAAFIHRKSIQAFEELTHEDFKILRQKADALCDDARRLADGIRAQLKDL